MTVWSKNSVETGILLHDRALRSNRVSLRKYRRLHPGKRIFDLGQTPGVRGRTELQNNELPTLARSTSHLWYLVCL